MKTAEQKAAKKLAQKAKKAAAHALLNNNKGLNKVEFLTMEAGIAKYNEQLAHNNFVYGQ